MDPIPACWEGLSALRISPGIKPLLLGVAPLYKPYHLP